MPPRKSPPRDLSEPARSELTEPMESAQQRISQRLDKGLELYGQNAVSDHQLESLKHEHKNWDDYNRALLLKLFTTDAECKQYSARAIPPAWFGLPSAADR